SFARRGRVRAELYLNAKERERVKNLFDAVVTRRAELEQRFVGPLSWERLDDKTATRVAQNPEGSITAAANELESIRAGSPSPRGGAYVPGAQRACRAGRR